MNEAEVLYHPYLTMWKENPLLLVFYSCYRKCFAERV